MQCGSVDDVVDLGKLLVDALDEIVFDGGDRQGAGADVGRELIVLTLE
jgi:hypothetical protein